MLTLPLDKHNLIQVSGLLSSFNSYGPSSRSLFSVSLKHPKYSLSVGAEIKYSFIRNHEKIMCIHYRPTHIHLQRSLRGCRKENCKIIFIRL